MTIIDQKGKDLLLQDQSDKRWNKLYTGWASHINSGIKDKDLEQKLKNRLLWMEDQGFKPKKRIVIKDSSVEENILVEEPGNYTIVVQQENNLVSKKVKFQMEVASKFAQLYKSAKNRNKEFDLELKDVAELLLTKKCYYTGVDFEKEGDLKKTIDRVDNARGYVKGNVVACTFLANNVKEMLFEKPTRELGVNIQFVSNVANTVLAKSQEEKLK